MSRIRILAQKFAKPSLKSILLYVREDNLIPNTILSPSFPPWILMRRRAPLYVSLLSLINNKELELCRPYHFCRLANSRTLQVCLVPIIIILVANVICHPTAIFLEHFELIFARLLHFLAHHPDFSPVHEILIEFVE
jgi:hypothetical protein